MPCLPRGYVLAHQDDFDVRWCKGTIAEEIFQPWVSAIRNAGGRVLGARRVALVEPPGDPRRESPNKGRVVATTADGISETHRADVVVMATGVGAAAGIIAASPKLAAAEGLSGVAEIPSTDVIAVRLFLDRAVTLPNASNVFSGFDLRPGQSPGRRDARVEGVGSTRDIAGTFFDLCALHDEYKRVGVPPRDAPGSASTGHPTVPGAVIEVDLYNAGAVLDLSDEDLVAAALDGVLRRCVPDRIPADARVIDSSVLRFRGGVTKFAPGTAKLLPSTVPAGLEGKGVYFAGDWMAQGPGSHGARGLSQEKALVSGLKAGDAAADGARRAGSVRPPRDRGVGAARAPTPAVVQDTDEDEPHVTALKEAVRAADASGLLGGASPGFGGFPPFPPLF